MRKRPQPILDTQERVPPDVTNRANWVYNLVKATGMTPEGIAMTSHRNTRREFMRDGLAGAGALAMANALPIGAAAASRAYEGPNVILVRFGGGVRPQDVIDPAKTYAPYFCHEFVKRGTLYPNMEISQLEGIETSHGQGTLYLLTGKYERYKDVGGRFLGQRFEAPVPTIFEYFRKMYDVPEHQALIVNGEDRTDEEFYAFSNHHLFGVEYRSNVLSLYRFKTFLLRRQINAGAFQGNELKKQQKELAKLEELDYRVHHDLRGQSDEIEAFWERWRQYYGDTGFVNPRGDRLLTELSLRALKELRPKLLMINYNDPDYVHWGNASHYTRGISVIDQGLRQLVDAVEADEEYRDNTVFVVVPDCGRDTSPMASVPFQHHFHAHSIFAAVMGTGVARGQIVDKLSDQISVAGTIGYVMGLDTPFTEGPVLQEAIA